MDDIANKLRNAVDVLNEAVREANSAGMTIDFIVDNDGSKMDTRIIIHKDAVIGKDHVFLTVDDLFITTTKRY